jgi:hypothetical protein
VVSEVLGRGCSSVVEHTLSTIKALSSIPSTKKKKEKEILAILFYWT